MSPVNPYAPPRGAVADDLLFIFGARRQGIRDLIADTIVVRA